MEYALNWERVRFEIDIEQYFLFKLGHLYQFDKYKKAYISENGGDIIRFFKHEQSGVKMYYSIKFQDSGDIIQFIKKRILCNENTSAKDINEEIFSFSGFSSSLKQKSQQNYSSNKKIESENSYENFVVYGNIIQNINTHKNYLCEYRKLNWEVLETPLFANIFYSYITQSVQTLSFDIQDIELNRVGIVRIQTEKNEYFNKKWFEKNSRNGIGFTFSNFLPNTETLSIFESIFDAISFHEINKIENVQYCSTNGELSFRKAKFIHEYFHKKKFKRLILGNDNDLAGHFFNLNIICSFISVIKNVRKSQNNICVEIACSNEDRKIKVLSSFFKKSSSKLKLEDASDLPQSFFTETLSPNSITYFFLIANSIDSIQFFVGLLFRIWCLEKITIQIPKNKDFNEDLIQLKTLNHG